MILELRKNLLGFSFIVDALFYGVQRYGM